MLGVPTETMKKTHLTSLIPQRHLKSSKEWLVIAPISPSLAKKNLLPVANTP